MKFYELFGAITSRVVHLDSYENPLLIQAAAFKKMLEQKFLYYGLEKTTEISADQERKVEDQIEKMMNMFSVFNIYKPDQDTYIDPLINVYNDPTLNEKQAELTELFKGTCKVLGIEIKIEEVEEEVVDETNTTSSVLINRPVNHTNDNGSTSYDMQILGGFIAILGIAAVAIAFSALNIATVGGASLAIAGFVTTGVGLALMVNGIFSGGTTVKPASEPEFTKLTTG